MCVPGEFVGKGAENFLNAIKKDSSKTFALFYIYTFIFVILCSFLTTIQEFFGDPIYCNTGGVSIIIFYYLVPKFKN